MPSILSARVFNISRLTRSVIPSIVLIVIHACSTSRSTEGSCPPASVISAVDIGCVPERRPFVQTRGPCEVNAAEPGDGRHIYIQNKDAGTCHVEVDFGDGVTSAVDFDIESMWRPLGADPHGCGPDFLAINAAGEPCITTCRFPLSQQNCDSDAGI